MEKLIRNLIDAGALKTERIIKAFENIDRKDFVLPEFGSEAYEDYPLPIGYGQTISQPYTVAFMLELLQPKKGDKVLDVGSGSGYTTALIADMVSHKGFVWGLEIIPELVALGSNNLKKYNFKNAEIIQAKERLGLVEKSPFDKILVSASAREVPNELLGQLKNRGIMVIPVGADVQKITKISKTKIKTEVFSGFVFVPLK